MDRGETVTGAARRATEQIEPFLETLPEVCVCGGEKMEKGRGGEREGGEEERGRNTPASPSSHTWVSLQCLHWLNPGQGRGQGT